MNRLGKKCLVASAGFHLLLLVILFVGPALTTPPAQDLPLIEFVPDILTDKPLSGGGNPNVRPPTPQPPQPRQQEQVPTPQPPPPRPAPRTVEPSPQVDKTPPAKTEKTDPNAVDTKRHKIEVNTKLTTRSKVQDTPKSSNSSKSSDATDVKSAREFSKAASRIRAAASPSTEIESFGPGGGGPAYANYAAWVKTVYTDAWIAPDDVDDDEATATVSVTIARDGTVLNARIITRSGNAAVDRSVQSALERVKTIGRPFPEGVKEDQRTYKINFNLKAKQLLG